MSIQAPVRSETGEKPTRVRYWVIVFAVTLAIITYIDRVCMSQAAPFIMADLNLSRVQMSYIFSAFALAYALFEIPGGYMGDWLGPRRVLMRVVVWWSACTILIGRAWSFASLYVLQLLFGAGEAGCYPNLTKAFTVWLPHPERVRAQGIMWMFSRWGGAFTPAIVIFLLQFMSWRWVFTVFGCVGIVWAVVFYSWFRDNPADKKSLNEAERRLLAGAEKTASGHGDVPWARLVRSRQAWMLCLQYFCLSYGWYFYITWLPTYLKEARGLDLARSAQLAVLPLFLGGIGSFTCGLAYPAITRFVGSLKWSRRIMAYIGFAGATTLLIVSVNLKDPLYAMIAMGFASFCNDLVMPGSWGACMDVGGKYAGTLSGAMNMMGNFGGVASPLAIGYMLARTNNNWELTFYVSAAVYFLGVVFWSLLDPVKPFDPVANPEA
jgi:ACS family glucarate transporter-like MFS transporter